MRATANNTFRPNLEALEGRLVMSATFGGGAGEVEPYEDGPGGSPSYGPAAAVFLRDGAICIEGTEGADSVTVTGPGFNATSFTVTANGRATTFRSSDVGLREVRFYGRGGNDFFHNDTLDLRTVALGEEGDDYLIGGFQPASLYGGNGHDTLEGRANADLLIGDAGNDVLPGGVGNDTMHGGTGYDQLYGSFGDDWLDGGNDGVADSLHGGYGADTFVAEWYWGGWAWQFNRETNQDLKVFPDFDRVI
jgi:Ca2+-binding RTX toxin-like protein